MLKREREEHELVLGKFSTALKDLEELKQESKTLTEGFKHKHHNENSDQSQMPIEQEKRLDIIDENEEEVIDTSKKIQECEFEDIGSPTGDDEINNNFETDEQKVENNHSATKTQAVVNQTPNKTEYSERLHLEEQVDSNSEKQEEEVEDEPGFLMPNLMHLFAESNLEFERILMEQEDRASRILEDSMHRQKFKDKYGAIQMCHKVLTSREFFNTPVCANSSIQDPVRDSFTKYMGNLRPIDLSKTKFRVLWSKEKVAKEKEEKRLQKEKAKREKKKKVIKSLVNILESNSSSKALFKAKDSLYNEIKAKPEKAVEYVDDHEVAGVDISHNVTGRLYPSKADIIYHKTVVYFAKTKEKLTEFMEGVQPPQFREFLNDQEKLYKNNAQVQEIWNSKKAKGANKRHRGVDSNRLHVIEEDLMDEMSGEFDSRFIEGNQPLAEALQVSYPGKGATHIDIKNEDELVELDMKALTHYHSLKDIDFSMNSIANLSMSDKAEFKCLTKIKVSQNKISKLDKNLFLK